MDSTELTGDINYKKIAQFGQTQTLERLILMMSLMSLTAVSWNLSKS